MSYGYVNGDGPIVPEGASGGVTRAAVWGGGSIGTQPRGVGFQAGNLKDALFKRLYFVRDRERKSTSWAIELLRGKGTFADKTKGIQRARFWGALVRDW